MLQISCENEGTFTFFILDKDRFFYSKFVLALRFLDYMECYFPFGLLKLMHDLKPCCLNVARFHKVLSTQAVVR